MAVAARSCSGRGQAAIALWLILLLVGDSSNGQAQAATIAATASATTTATQHLKFGVAGDTPTLTATTKHEQQQRQHSSNTTATTAATTAATATVANASSQSITTTTPTTTTEQLTQSVDAVVRLLDLEVTAAPPIGSGHDGLKLTKKKQLQQQHFATAATTTSKLEIDTTDAPSTISTTSTTSTTPDSSTKPELLPVPNGYLGPIFMGEKTFSVAHPLKKPLAPNHQEPAPHDDTIEQQLREGRIVEILAPTALLESNVESSSQRPATTTSSTTTSSSSSSSTTLPAAPHTQSVMSTTVFQVPEPQSSTTRLPMAAAEITVAGSAVLAAPPRTESKISDIQIEVYDSTVDSIVASTNFRDSQGYYPKPLERWPVAGTTKPPSSPMAQERFTQYVIDRADVSTQPAAGMGQAVLGVAGVGGVGKPEPAAIEIHINVSEAFGNESEDLEFSYRQPAAGDAKASKPNDEILVVEIIDNSTENISSASAEHLNLSSMFSYPYHSDAPPPAVRPPQDAADELFMADTKGGDRAGLPRPPPPPPPPPPPLPRKPSIDRDSDTIFYISNTEVKVGESLPTASSSSEQQQQRKLQFENQFFPASYRQDPSQLQSQSQSPSQSERSSAVTARYEEDIILSPQHHTADALKILRSPSSSSDGAPPLDVTYVGESVIEVEQQSVPPLVPASSQQPDIIIQPAVLPDLAIGVPVIGELPPQIELKEIDYMPGELIGQGRSIYENDIESNGLGLSSDPDVIESSIQYGGDLIDDGAGGGFDGVEGSYPFESPAHRLQQQDAEQAQHGLSHQSINHGFSHLHREELPMAELLNATLQLHNESAKGSKSGAASAMAPLLHGERMGNATALSEDPLANYDGFLNLFAVSMGLIIVVLPAGLLTSMYCAVRYLLNKNANSSAAGDDSEQGHGQDSKHESSSSSSSSSVASFASPTSQPSSQQAAAAKAMPNRNSNPELNLKPNASLIRSMSLALTSGVQCIEFQFETSPDIRTPPPTGGATPTISGTAFTFSGSVTKMTLKDNHLIVVTEERHDISRNARETKMHTDKDGVFVVEVARGIDSKQPPDSPAAGVDITELPFDTSNKLSALEERSLPPSHEQVQIHAPPSDFANQPAAVGVGAAAGLQLIEEEQLLPDEEHDTDRQQPIQSQTGLSQSDLSSTSSSDSNKRYSYGNQELYVIEQPGYANDSPMVLMSQLESGAANASERMPEQQEPQQQQEQQEQREQQEQQEQQKQQEQKEQQMPQEQQEQQEQQEEQEQPVPAPAAFGNDNETVAEQVTVNVEEAKEQQAKEEPENNYDSLMSLPAPPSTEEIKEFNDFTLMESNQLDSLPPPPPPLSEPAIGNGHQHDEDAEQEEQEEQEEQQQKELEEQLAKEQELEQEQEQELEQEQEPKQQLKLANGKICAPPNTAEHTNGTGTGQEQPSTLTPPASPPASPSAATLCAGSLANGIHAVPQPMVVDVNGS